MPFAAPWLAAAGPMPSVPARLLLALALLLCGALQAQPPPAQNLPQAWRSTASDAAGQRVALPDWLPPPDQAAPPGQTVQAVYRFEAELGATPGPLAVYLPGVFGHLRLAVNGRVIQDGLRDPPGPSPRGIHRLRLIEIAEPQLRPGLNRIEITLRAAGRIGLSPLWIGPPEALQAMRERKAFGLVYGPGLVAVIIGCLGLSVLLLYLRRPSDTLYGLFGMVALAWGLHTLWTVLPTQLLPGEHNYLWWVVLYSFVVASLAVFALRFAGYAWRRVERGLWIASAAAAPVFYAARALGGFAQAEQAWRLGMVGVACAGLVAVAVKAWRRRSTDSALLVFAGLAAASLGLADWVINYRGDDNLPVTLESINRELEQRVEQRRLELADALDSMRRARDAAEAANRAKSSFLAAASHDLRQPMHALGLYIAALRGLPLDDPQRDLAARIAGSVTALESMFDSLLDISRMDAGAVVPEPCAFDIESLLRRLVAELAPDAEARSLRLSLRIAPAARRLRALSDPLLLERVLRNLIGNALKYTWRGGVLVSCRLRGDGAQARWRVEVWDTGPGIPPAEQTRVFDEFYQVGNPARDRRAGLGLGLSVVRRLTGLLALPLQLHSQAGRGSRFRVDIPTTPAPAPVPEEASAPGSVVGLGVAVIEDDAEVRESMQRLLTGWGCRVAAGSTADEVQQLALSQGLRLDSAVADLRLREGHDGLGEIAALRRACGRALPALLVSGDSAPERVALMQGSGLPWMFKPVAAARLRSWLVAAMPAATQDRS